MNYLCLVYFEESAMTSLSDAERTVLNRDSLAYDVELERRGQYILARALQSPPSAAIVRVRKGKILVTDGPFTEAKEQLAGFILIEAEDQAEAIEAASGIPLAKLGSIEVRPIYDIPRS